MNIVSCFLCPNKSSIINRRRAHLRRHHHEQIIKHGVSNRTKAPKVSRSCSSSPRKLQLQQEMKTGGRWRLSSWPFFGAQTGNTGDFEVDRCHWCPSEDPSDGHGALVRRWDGTGASFRQSSSPGRTPLASPHTTKVRTVCPEFWLQTNKLDLIPVTFRKCPFLLIVLNLILQIKFSKLGSQELMDQSVGS